jgi:hypothetical protein
MITVAMAHAIANIGMAGGIAGTAATVMDRM